MLYLSPIYAMLHLFGHKTLIQLKGFTYYRKNPSECSFKVEIPIQVLYLKCPKFLGPLIRQSLKTASLLKKYLKVLSSIFNNWFKFSFESHSHDTRWSYFGYRKVISYHTKT